jgi:hypothetical protein
MKRAEIPEFLKELHDLFDGQMEELMKRGLLKKKQLEDMKAGFRDGSRICLTMLQEKGHLKVDE